MAAAGLPAPAELAMWARLLLAADRLAREPRPVDDIALSLGFSGDNALRNACRRWLDASPTELRAGGLELALTRFRTRMHTVRTQRARLRSGPSGALATTAPRTPPSRPTSPPAPPAVAPAPAPGRRAPAPPAP
ncbi:MAG: helix-turn-helix domain-containing protein [Gemmatimonadaceae bacterium]|nr:helix-turn-helix domain-containing protein [Gemmatimonadaceae bacterium]